MLRTSRQGGIMFFDASIAKDIQSQVESLTEMVSDDRSDQAQTACEVESHLS
jgi:hypothetical protein